MKWFACKFWCTYLGNLLLHVLYPVVAAAALIMLVQTDIKKLYFARTATRNCGHSVVTLSQLLYDILHHVPRECVPHKQGMPFLCVLAEHLLDPHLCEGGITPCLFLDSYNDTCREVQNFQCSLASKDNHWWEHITSSCAGEDDSKAMLMCTG